MPGAALHARVAGRARRLSDTAMWTRDSAQIQVYELRRLLELAADTEIGRILETLHRGGELVNTVVVVVSDHGEEFQDHGGWLHGRSVYDELVRVPLVVSWPGKIEPG